MNIVSSILILIAIVLSFVTLLALVGWLRDGEFNVLLPGLGLIVSLPGLIILLLISNIFFVIAAAAVKPKKEFSNVASSVQNFEYPDDIFSGCGNGVLDLSVAKDPDNYDAGIDRALKICINDDDLEAISLAIFNAENGKPYDDAEHILKKRNDDRELFQRLFPAYPMLGRINYIYEDVIFTPEEVKKLRDECLRLKSPTANSSTDLALRKLIYACDEALKDNFYLMFSSD